MRFNRLDLNQLVSLEALLTEQNVSRAAERLNLTQPAMSWTLARLREYFDDKLLVQVGRRMMLTPFGESLLEPVRDLLMRAQVIAERRPEVDPARMEREISLVASDYIARTLLAEVMRRTAEQAPGLRFALRQVDEYLPVQLDRGEVDLVILAREGADERHPVDVLLQDEYVCIASVDNDAVTDALDEKQFYAMPHVVTAWSGPRMPMHDHVLDRGERRRHIEITVPNFTLTPDFVVGTRRVATVQRRLAQLMARQWDIKILPCPVPIPPIQLVLQCHRQQVDDPCLSWCRSLLKAVAAE